MAKKTTSEEFATERESQLADEIARLNAQLDAAKANGGKLLDEIPGEYRIEGFETPDGKVLSGSVKFKPGKKHIVAFGARVSTEAMLKVANGEPLTLEESAKNPALVKAGRAAVEAKLQKWILNGANLFNFTA